MKATDYEEISDIMISVIANCRNYISRRKRSLPAKVLRADVVEKK